MKKLLLLITLTLSFTLLSGCGLIATRETATLPAVEIPFPATPEIATATEMSLPTLSPPTPEPTLAPTPTEFIVAPIYARLCLIITCFVLDPADCLTRSPFIKKALK